MTSAPAPGPEAARSPSSLANGKKPSTRPAPNRASEQWRTKYGTRGIEGTIHQAVAVTGMRRARYRGLPKTHLEHAFSAVALNLLRLDAWWNGHPLDRTRTGHLARLDLSLAA
ncbi:transposase [Streptomyces atratus]|uniref:transposase n=1 Tax=Streptomyces atratus TaxID=1893 RepID=UPI0037A37DF1